MGCAGTSPSQSWVLKVVLETTPFFFLRTHKSLVLQGEELFGEEKTGVVLSEVKALETSDDLFRIPKANQCIEPGRHFHATWPSNTQQSSKNTAKQTVNFLLVPTFKMSAYECI